MAVNWRHLFDQPRKALTLKELPANIRQIFKKRINSDRGVNART